MDMTTILRNYVNSIVNNAPRTPARYQALIALVDFLSDEQIPYHELAAGEQISRFCGRASDAAFISLLLTESLADSLTKAVSYPQALKELSAFIKRKKFPLSVEEYLDLKGPTTLDRYRTVAEYVPGAIMLNEYLNRSDDCETILTLLGDVGHEQFVAMIGHQDIQRKLSEATTMGMVTLCLWVALR